MAERDTGNPNVFKIFMGRYPTTDNRFVMLTILNDVQFMDDYTADGTGKLTTLPTQCRPANAMKILAPIQRANSRATSQIEVVTDVTTADKTVVTNGASSTMNYIESATSQTHKALTDIEPVFNTGVVSTLGNGVGQANGLQLTEGSFTALTKATSKSTTVVNNLTNGTVKSINGVKKTTITVGTDEHSLPYGVVTINPDGTVMGEANSTYYMNGISFNISGNFYH
jgi:hypothetical protein